MMDTGSPAGPGATNTAGVPLELPLDDERLAVLLPKLRQLMEDFRVLEALDQPDVEPL